MKPWISELKRSPRFVEEYGSYEGWVWPLKCAHKTHILRIEHPALGPIYVRYVLEDHEIPGDFIVYRIGDSSEKTVRERWELEVIKRWLEKYKAEFVRR